MNLSDARGSAAKQISPDTATLSEFNARLASDGRRAGVQLLNRNTSHRFTGIFQFSGEILKCIELVDKWDWTVSRCDDAPIESAYCAHLQRTGQPLVVVNGRVDPRTRWMSQSRVVSYCGAVIESPVGRPWGALCHFDRSPCESNPSQVALLHAAARLIWPALGAVAA